MRRPLSIVCFSMTVFSEPAALSKLHEVASAGRIPGAVRSASQAGNGSEHPWTASSVPKPITKCRASHNSRRRRSAPSKRLGLILRTMLRVAKVLIWVEFGFGYHTAALAQELGMIQRVQALEKILENAVVASPSPCESLGPRWVVYRAAEGRFLLGASTRIGAGRSGGEETVALTVPNLPPHGHPINVGNDNNMNNHLAGSTSRSGIGRTFDPNKSTLHQVIGPVGSGEPHNNMPPYRAMYFCEYQ